MDIQSLLTYLFDAIAFGYVALIILDLGNCLSGKLLDIFCSSSAPAATKTFLRMSANCAPTVELSALEAESRPSAFEPPMVEALYTTKCSLRMHSIPATPVNLFEPADERVSLLPTPLVGMVADPWLEITTPTCSRDTSILRLDPENPSHTAIATSPQLLLSPALEVANQPELTALPNTELRKRCQSAGIKWRNAHGTNKHLSKPEMVAALGS